MHALDPPVLDLRGIEPAPDRLLEVASGFCPDSEAVVVDWGGRFPWSLGSGRHRVLPEALVAKTVELLAARGTHVWHLLRDLPPPEAVAWTTVRHLRAAAQGRAPRWIPALVSHAESLLEDVKALAPAVCGFAVPAGTPLNKVLRSAVSSLPSLFIPEDSAATASLTSLELHLLQLGHPLAGPSEIAAWHQSVEDRRADGWRVVARLHEALLAGHRDGAGQLRLLGRAIREMQREIPLAEELYGVRVPVNALRTEMRGITGPLREQHAMLGARVASGRHPPS